MILSELPVEKWPGVTIQFGDNLGIILTVTREEGRYLGWVSITVRWMSGEFVDRPYRGMWNLADPICLPVHTLPDYKEVTT